MSEFIEDVVVDAKRSAQEKEDRIVTKALGGRTHLTQAARKDLQRARKSKMRTKVFYLCDGCGNTITEPEHGFVIHGNIYVADPAVRGGLIGNNFPNVESDTPITIEDVEQTVLCKSCFCSALGLIKSATRTRNKPKGEVKFQGKFPDLQELQERQGLQEEPEIPFEPPVSGSPRYSRAPRYFDSVRAAENAVEGLIDEESFIDFIEGLRNL